MARTYRLTSAQRFANSMFRLLTRLGIGARYRYVLTVPGRRSGLPRSTPVDVMAVGGERYLVAPYGVVSWVRNVRTATELTLSRAGKVATFTAEEIRGEAAAPVIRAYLKHVPVTRAYWDVGVDASDAELAGETSRHPVFRLTACPDPSAAHDAS